MAIDIQSLFNPGSLQQMAETEDDRKKKAQLTGTMNLGGQTGTFTGTFDPQAFQQMQNNMSAPVGYQPPPNYGMQAPPEQQPVPVIQPPAPTPPAGTSPISGEFFAPPAPPAPLPPANQPYVAPPAEPYVAPPNYYGDLTPGQALGGEFTVQPPAQTAPQFPGPSDLYNSDGTQRTIEELGALNPEFRVSNRPPVQQPVAVPTPIAPPAPVAPPNYYGDLTPGEALGGEFTMRPPARDPRFAGMPDDMYNAMMEFNQTVGPGGFMTMDVKPWDQWMYDQQNQPVQQPVMQPVAPVAPVGMGFGLS